MKTNKSKKYEKGSKKVGDFNTLMSFILYMSDIMNHEHRMKNIHLTGNVNIINVSMSGRYFNQSASNVNDELDEVMVGVLVSQN